MITVMGYQVNVYGLGSLVMAFTLKTMTGLLCFLKGTAILHF
jgi:hypothetical protein